MQVYIPTLIYVMYAAFMSNICFQWRITGTLDYDFVFAHSGGRKTRNQSVLKMAMI